MKLIPRRPVGPPRKVLAIAVVAFFLALLYSWRQAVRYDVAILGKRPSALLGGVAEQESTCPLDVEYLQDPRYGLKNDVIFYRQCIRASVSEGIDRSAVDDVPGSMFGYSQALNLDAGCHQWEKMPCDPINLDVPTPFPARQYPELLFGVATSFDRLVDSLPQLAHWLGGTGARLVAVVVDASDHEADIGRLIAFYNDHGVDIVIAWPEYVDLNVNEQHFTVIRDLLRHATPETKWVGIIDDDTFFPSLYPLSEVLLSQDDTRPAYLGGLSDNMDAIQFHGLMAYGGAGVFLSMPLVRELAPHIETCLRQSNTQEGDALLKNCIYGQTNTRLTLVPGLNQLDIIGDASGFYESGRFPLSLHHWKTWHRAPVDMMAKASDFCGGCFLQRWRFGSDTVLANGYSVARYTPGIEHHQLNRTEGTWENSHLFDWTYGPLRDKTETFSKKSFFLMEAHKVGDSLRQVYIHHGGHAKDEVLELWWNW